MDGRLNALFKERLKLFHWQRVETAGTGLGIPDLNYCCSGFEGWLELKGCSGWRCGLRPEQAAWIARRVRAGGNVHIAVRRQAPASARRKQAADELWLFCGCKVQELITCRLMVVQPRGCWYGGPAKWDWPAVGKVLTTGCRHQSHTTR